MDPHGPGSLILAELIQVFSLTLLCKQTTEHWHWQIHKVMLTCTSTHKNESTAKNSEGKGGGWERERHTDTQKQIGETHGDTETRDTERQLERWTSRWTETDLKSTGLSWRASIAWHSTGETSGESLVRIRHSSGNKYELSLILIPGESFKVTVFSLPHNTLHEFPCEQMKIMGLWKLLWMNSYIS